MQHLKTKGLVMRETDFGEADRYISVLTEQGVRIEVLCKGVRRRNSRLAAAVRLFCWSELTLYEGRGDFVPLPGGAYAAMVYVLTQDMPRVFAFTLGGEAKKTLAGLCEKYALYYAEKSFGSLDFYHTLVQME